MNYKLPHNIIGQATERIFFMFFLSISITVLRGAYQNNANVSNILNKKDTFYIYLIFVISPTIVLWIDASMGNLFVYTKRR